MTEFVDRVFTKVIKVKWVHINGSSSNTTDVITRRGDQDTDKHGTRRERLISKTQGRKINTQPIEQIKKYSKLVDVNSHRPIIKWINYYK